MNEDPGTLALFDQVGAADDEIEGIITHLATEPGVVVRYIDDLGPVLEPAVWGMKQRMVAAQESGADIACGHIYADPSTIATWWASQPERWLCIECIGPRLIRGPALCDGCELPTKLADYTRHLVHSPAMRTLDDPSRPAITPAAAIVICLCPECTERARG